MNITFDLIKDNQTVQTYIRKADESLIARGFTEHSFAHVTRVAKVAQELLLKLGYDERDAELAAVAGYLHDIGNVINRIDHAQSGAVMAFRILDNMGVDTEEIATIITAIGNHDESTAYPVNHVAAALIIADKTDVRRSRVRNTDASTFDIHDRVNYAVEDSKIKINGKQIEVQIKLDKTMCSVMDYFEIFLERMILCRKAAEKLGAEFCLTINKERVI